LPAWQITFGLALVQVVSVVPWRVPVVDFLMAERADDERLAPHPGHEQ